MTSERPPLHILIVDDDEVDREAVRRALQTWGAHATVEESDSIREAEQKLEGTDFDCVILDYLLPEGPSITFIPRLKERSGAAFLILTGQGDEQIAVDAMKAGAADYLSKDGLDPARLRRAVRYAVSLGRAERAASEARAEQARHTDQLRRFVEAAPTLVGARTLDDLAGATAELVSSLFDASEALVALTCAGAEITAHRGEPQDDPQLASWAEERRLSPAPEPRVSQDHVAVALTSRDGERRGTIAARVPHAIHASERHVLEQIGVLVSVCSDNLLLYDAAAKAVRARDDVLAAVSHDLRTPLNNVRLGASLLHEAAPQSRSIVDRIDRSVVHMTHLVDDLVDMVRIEGGKIDLAWQTERVEELLSAARHLIAPQAEAQRLRLVVAPPSGPLAVRADRHRTLQVLMNLLGNAVKFTPEGGEVTLCAADDGDFVRFEVRDTGVGIPEAEGERIFSRFWRSDPKKRRGLGLGLYIAKGLVVAQGGRLWFESRPGQGSRFFFTLAKVAAEAR